MLCSAVLCSAVLYSAVLCSVLCHSVTAVLYLLYCTAAGDRHQWVSDWLKREFFLFFFLVRSFGESKRNGEGPFSFNFQILCVECAAVRERVQLFNFSKEVDRNIQDFRTSKNKMYVHIYICSWKLKTTVLLALQYSAVCRTNIVITRLKHHRHPDLGASGWGWALPHEENAWKCVSRASTLFSALPQLFLTSSVESSRRTTLPYITLNWRYFKCRK